MARQRKCKHCGAKKPADEGIQTPVSWFCSTDCAYQYQLEVRRKQQERAKRKAIQSQAKDKKERSKARRELDRESIPWQLKQTQIAFNKMRVLEELKWFKDNNLEPTCISCGKPNMDWCCGHFKTRGSQPNLSFDRKNTYLQCNKYCNMSLSGNISGNKNTRGYLQGLRDRFGEEEARAIIDYCESETKPVKWTREILEGMRKEFNAEIRKLKSELES